MSNTINPDKEIITAFVEAQKEMKSALKDSENPFFKSKYADLHSVDAACRSALNSHGIAISQQIDFEGDIDFIRTELLHISGTKLTSRCRLVNPKKDAQGLGIAITYMRRYSLAAICGIVTEDDDGEGARSAPAGAILAGKPTPSKHSSDNNESIEDYVVSFGKYKGQTLRDQTLGTWISYSNYLEGESKKSGKPMQGAAFELSQMIKALDMQSELIAFPTKE